MESRAKGPMVFSRIFTYWWRSMVPWMRRSLLIPWAEKLPHTMTHRLPCFTVGVGYFGSYLEQTGRLVYFTPSDLNKLHLLSFDRCTRDHSAYVYPTCDLAYETRVARFFAWMNGFLDARFPGLLLGRHLYELENDDIWWT